MKKSGKLILMVITFVLVVISIYLVNATVERVNSRATAGWGDNCGGRESYTKKQISAGILDDSIIFNSISDNPIGNEKNFVDARLNNGVNNVWNANEIKVEDGKEYYVRLYVHNNNPNGLDAISTNTSVAFSIPTVSAKTIAVYGFIYSDNATPSEYWDGVTFTADNAFHLEYQYGSAVISNNGIGEQDGGYPISDDIVLKAGQKGTLIGYDKLDGRLPGGNDYASIIGIRVKAVYDYDYTVSQKVRIADTKGWPEGDYVDAEVGDEVEFQIEYVNTDEITHKNVMIRDILPKNLEYIEGSTKLYNSNFREGVTIDQDSIITTGINVGHYAPGANAIVRFRATVIDVSLIDGSNTLVNWSQCSVSKKTIQDYACVMLNKK